MYQVNSMYCTKPDVDAAGGLAEVHAYRRSAMSSPGLQLHRATPTSLVWRALVGEREVGSLAARVRPDRRCVFGVRGDDEGVRARLIDALASAVPNELLVDVREDDDQSIREYATLGFAPKRRESVYDIAVAAASLALALADMSMPAGVVCKSIADVDEDRLRELDDALRDDVPGTDGWQWSSEDFREETSAPSLDPELYLIVEDDRSGSYIAIVRVWVHQGRPPRLGFVGVARTDRRRGVARFLLAAVFRVLAERSVDAVSAEVDAENDASNALMAGLGAVRSGGVVELALAARPVVRAHDPR